MVPVASPADLGLPWALLALLFVNLLFLLIGYFIGSFKTLYDFQDTLNQYAAVSAAAEAHRRYLEDEYDDEVPKEYFEESWSELREQIES